MNAHFPAPILDALRAHARASFPDEACGFVVERDGHLEAVRVTNIQDLRHAEDPVRFARTAATAYTMGDEAVPVLIGHDRGTLTIRAIYHSHPQHAAYFSPEDKRQATVWDEPSYPDVAQLVFSVIDGEVQDARAFRWDAAARDFVEVDIAEA